MSKLSGISGVLRFASVILMCMGLAAQDRKSIAYIGHGAMFDQEGGEHTLSFLWGAQAWYRTNLSDKINGNQRAAFGRFERGMKQGLDLDPRWTLEAERERV
jgi:hypothetical protein